MNGTSKFLVLDDARWRLFYVWLGGAAILCVLMLIRSSRQDMTEDMQAVADAWAWFLPNIAPTVILMIGVVISSAFDHGDRRLVRRRVFHLGIIISIAYLLLILLLFIIEYTSGSPFKQLTTIWSYPLAFVQGLAASVIGVLFTMQKKDEG